MKVEKEEKKTTNPSEEETTSCNGEEKESETSKLENPVTEKEELDETIASSNTEEKKKGFFGKKDKKEEKIKQLEDQIKELEEKELRQKAELINYRKRKEEETSRLLKYANEDIIKSLLIVIDNFERAIDMDDDNLEDEVSKFLAGFKMIYCNMTSILEQFGVTEIKALNEPFDPTVHQAVLSEKKDGVEADYVIEVLQKGYRLKDRILRPAMVKVSE